MSVSGVSGGSSAASYLSSPAVQFARFQGAALATLFAGSSGSPSDLNSITPTLVASSLFQRPGLLTGLTGWDGSMTPGSQRTATPPAPTPAPAPAIPPAPKAPPASPFTFNPFDQASWWADPKGSAVDTSS
jgi:hypothetical protein